MQLSRCMLYLQGRAQDAMQLLRAALLSAPGYAEAWNTLGVLHRDLGQMQVQALSIFVADRLAFGTFAERQLGRERKMHRHCG